MQKPFLRRRRIIGPAFPYNIGIVGPAAAPPAYVGAGDALGAPIIYGGLRSLYAAAASVLSVALKFNTGSAIGYYTIAGGGLNLSTYASDLATFGSPVNVSTFYDQSGTNNHWIAGTMPNWNLTGMGSLPSIDYVSSTPSYLTTTVNIAAAINQPFTIAFVARCTNAAFGSYQYVLSDSAGGGSAALSFSPSAVPPNVGSYAGGAAAAIQTVTVGTFAAIVCVLNGASSATYVNGVSGSVASIGTAGLIVGQLWLGNSTDTPHGLDGGIVELGIWSGDKSSSVGAFTSGARNYYGF